MNKFRAICICFLFLSICTSTQLISRGEDFIITPRIGINSLVGEMGEDFGMGIGLGAMFEYMYTEKLGLSFGASYNTFPTTEKTLYSFDQQGNEIQAKFDYSLSDISFLIGFNYYILDYRKKITPFLGLEAGWVLVTEKLSPIDKTIVLEDESNTQGYSLIAPHVGFTYPINKKMFLTLRGRYMLSFVNVTSTDGYGGFGETRSASFMMDYNYWSIQAAYSYIF